MAIFDTMRHIRPDVSTVCVGLAARYPIYGLMSCLVDPYKHMLLDVLAGRICTKISYQHYPARVLKILF